MSNKKEILVLSGGGVHGIAHVGALQYMHEKELLTDINTYCGVSVGALISSLLAVGYTPFELYTFVSALDLFKLIHVSITNLFGKRKFGLDDGKRIEYVIKRMIKLKKFNENITLQQLHKKTNKTLIIMTACVNRSEMCQLTHKTHPNLPVWKAIRMAISIPIFFTPVEYKKETFIDGGAMDSYPIHLFKDKIDKTIGVQIINASHTSTNINNIEDYIKGIIVCFFRGTQYNSKKGFEKQTIELEIKDPNMVNFVMSDKEKHKLYDLGYQASFNHHSNHCP